MLFLLLLRPTVLPRSGSVLVDLWLESALLREIKLLLLQFSLPPLVLLVLTDIHPFEEIDLPSLWLSILLLLLLFLLLRLGRL